MKYQLSESVHGMLLVSTINGTEIGLYMDTNNYAATLQTSSKPYVLISQCTIVQWEINVVPKYPQCVC